jgi:outer membrane protein
MRLVLSLLLLSASGAAFADQKICVMDTEKAISDTDEGKAAQSRLQTMYASKQAELDKKKKDLERQFQDYEARQVILSEEARKATEQQLWEKQQEFQATVMQAEEEMQSVYVSLVSGMEEKLLAIAQTTGAAKGCALVLDRAAALYVGSGVSDVTGDVIAAYNAKY